MDKLIKRIGSKAQLLETHLTTMQAASEAGVTRQGVIQSIASGRLKAIKFDNRYYILRSNLKEYMSKKWNRSSTKDDTGELVFDPDKGTFSVSQATYYVKKLLRTDFKRNRLYNLIKRKLFPFTKYHSAYVLLKADLDKLVILEKARLKL